MIICHKAYSVISLTFVSLVHFSSVPKLWPTWFVYILSENISCFSSALDSQRVLIFPDGNGFKTSTMRLGADVVVFSRATHGRYYFALPESATYDVGHKLHA